MASVQTPLRQPFGVLGSSKLRNLQSVKNCQNAIVPSSAPSVKRRHVDIDLSDSENVDPIDLKVSASKRKKTGVDYTDDDLCKPSSISLRKFLEPQPRIPRPSALTSRPQTPIINTAVKPNVVSSAPAAAGRSPTKSKRSGILSNRRTRLNAPGFGSRSSAPLSLAAALSGTLANKKQKHRVDAATLKGSNPKSWFFDVYEEPEEQQNFGVMTQSACTLDISDDEGKTAARDERGKENIPPDELNSTALTASTSVPSAQATTSRKDMMTDEPRTPLGDLNPSDYYAEGCDATSVVHVAEDVTEPERLVASDTAEDLKSQTTSRDSDFNGQPSATEGKQDKLMTASELGSLLLSAAPTLPSEHHDIEADLFHKCNNGDDAGVPEPADIEIWESGSANDDAGELEARESIFSEL